MKVFLSIFLVLFTGYTFSHSGGTDFEGGHFNHSTGDYHYHHGYPPHSHNNGCPYIVNDNGHRAKSRTPRSDNVYQKALGEAQYFFWLKLGVIFSFLLAINWGISSDWGKFVKNEKSQKYFVRIVLIPTFLSFYFFPIYHCIIKNQLGLAFEIIIYNFIIIIPILVASVFWTLIFVLLINGIKLIKVKVFDKKIIYSVLEKVSGFWEINKYRIYLLLMILWLLILFLIGPSLRPTKKISLDKIKQDTKINLEEFEEEIKEIHQMLDTIKLKSLNKDSLTQDFNAPNK